MFSAEEEEDGEMQVDESRGGQPTGERHVESNPVAQDVAVVEIGREKSNEQLLNKYLILHCAKLHLTVTDASSGEYIPNFSGGNQSFHT